MSRLTYVDGAVPPRLDDPVVERPLLTATRQAAVLHVPPVGRYLIRPGEPVVVERVAGATDDDVRAFLDTTVLGLAHLLEGRIALRAATVVIGGSAVVLCGVSAAGKSTTAAALAQRGHPVLADAVSVAAEGVAHAGPTALTLWPDALDWLGHESGAGRPVRPALTCRAVEPPATADQAPLAAVVMLGIGTPGRGTTVAEVRGADRIRALTGSEWHTALLGPLGLEAAHFRWSVPLAGLPMVRIHRDRVQRQPGAVADAVEALVA